ncbi:MAG: hypothetical protein AMXMBFR59_09520 [Rhodanobacteraceae bacterium]
MGAGFYMMFATSILIYRIADADDKQGFIWFGVNLCVTMAMGALFGLTVLMAVLGFVVTFLIMFLINLMKPDSSG